MVTRYTWYRRLVRWKGVSATLQGGRYTLSYPRGGVIILLHHIPAKLYTLHSRHLLHLFQRPSCQCDLQISHTASKYTWLVYKTSLKYDVIHQNIHGYTQKHIKYDEINQHLCMVSTQNYNKIIMTTYIKICMVCILTTVLYDIFK